MSFFSSPSVTWSLVVLLLTLLIVYGIWPYRFFKNLGIPGPRPFPIVGTTRLYAKGIQRFDMDCFKEYGKVWGIFDGRLPTLMVADTEMIKTIMVKECYTCFTNRRESNTDLSGPLADGIMNVKDEVWRRIRSTISPLFTSGQLKQIFPVVEQYANRLIDHLRKRDLTKPVQIKEVFGPYSMDVITSASFSVDIDSINNPQDPFVSHLKDFLQLTFSSPVFLMSIFFPFSTKIFRKLGIMMFPKRATDFLYTFLRKIKDQRQNEKNGRVDFLQLMIQGQIPDDKAEETSGDQTAKGLTDHEILSQSFIFILGGYDTTSTTLTFLMYNLATNPDALRKLVEEIDMAFPNNAPVTYEKLMDLEYLDMVMNESQRLLPTAGRAERVCKKTVEVNGVTIPKDTLVGIPTYVLHRDPQHWTSPEEFRPERFSKENKGDINPYAFLPFGLGPRNCVGMRFALLVMKTIVVKLFQNFHLETCKETQIPIQINPMGLPKTPVILKLVPRSSGKMEE
ncbi:cytochrome P450 3A30 isoform X2 [Chanos chanos]|uniref:Cytochrome P450 3A n=1 Tax=Chanos chanos TaxID=29144 RepID=A0A6J2WMN8_CHACN|nr:cytochrome P450 3A30-like isoform X1 [Chanos chanos]XP_030645784.1 cytochrome P450 3A30-like isoform X2 [Chanos chanos]